MFSHCLVCIVLFYVLPHTEKPGRETNPRIKAAIPPGLVYLRLGLWEKGRLHSEAQEEQARELHRQEVAISPHFR